MHWWYFRLLKHEHFFLWTNSCFYRYTELTWYDFMKRLWNDLPWQPIPWSCFPMSLYLLTAPRLPDIEIVFDTNKTPRVRHLLSPLGWQLLLRSSEHLFSLVKCAMVNRKKKNRFKIMKFSFEAEKLPSFLAKWLLAYMHRLVWAWNCWLFSLMGEGKQRREGKAVL